MSVKLVTEYAAQNLSEKYVEGPPGNRGKRADKKPFFYHAQYMVEPFNAHGGPFRPALCSPLLPASKPAAYNAKCYRLSSILANILASINPVLFLPSSGLAEEVLTTAFQPACWYTAQQEGEKSRHQHYGSPLTTAEVER